MNRLVIRMNSLNEFREYLELPTLTGNSGTFPVMSHFHGIDSDIFAGHALARPSGTSSLNEDVFYSMTQFNQKEYTKCPWCATKNKSDEPSCVRCGGPLG